MVKDTLLVTLEELFRSDATPYVDMGKACNLFNCVFELVIKKGILNTAALDLRRASDGKPLGLKFEFLKVLNQVCTEDKRHAQVGHSVWCPKDQKLGFKGKKAAWESKTSRR